MVDNCFLALIAWPSTKTKTKTKIKAFVLTHEPIIICNVILRVWFNPHRHYLERTKTFVNGFLFVFVLAHEQAIIILVITDLGVLWIDYHSPTRGDVVPIWKEPRPVHLPVIDLNPVRSNHQHNTIMLEFPNQGLVKIKRMSLCNHWILNENACSGGACPSTYMDIHLQLLFIQQGKMTRWQDEG